VGLSVLRKGFRPGTTSVVVLALLALERFGIEFLRAKDDRFLGGLTVAQGLSLGILIVLAGLWLRRPASAVGAGSPARRAA